MRAASLAIIVALAAALLVGCGGSAETTTSSPAGAGSSAREARSAWEADPRCKPSQGASRWGCSVGGYRCQGVVTDRGWSISCARPGRSIAFRVPRQR
ncbi:MAG: hypothetical protein ACJ76D_08845 [Solirubrobacterales bacterium]